MAKSAPRVSAAWKQRQDDIAHERQRRLGGLLVLSNVMVGGLTLGIILPSGWDPDLTSTEWIVFGVIVAFSWVNLLVAAGVIGWIVESASGALPESIGLTEGHADDWILDRGRMTFYYLGVWSNLLALALMIELSGGLAESPFVPLLIAFVLTGQQLSRFNTQSGLLYLSGLLSFVLLVLLEGRFSSPDVAPPHELTIAVAFLALATGGFLNWKEKPSNYMLREHVKQPSRARLYEDGCGAWRVSLLHKIHKQDPVILAGAEGGPATSGDGFPPQLQSRFDEYLRAVSDAAEWEPFEFSWPAKCTRSFSVQLTRIAPPQE